MDVEHGRCMSQEDKQVLDLWESSIRLHEGHYELPIPWRNPGAIIPNYYSVAKYRLDSLKKSLVKKELFNRYDAEVEKMLTSGYAEKVPQAEIKRQTGRIWYLPHHGVTSDKKPGKLRIVFDCAAKFEGESLNKCFQGPDLNNKLLTVLLNFRLHPVGIMGDIEAMYNQVKIPIKDRDALRFIWFKDDEIIHYRMTSHLLGGVWCASVATYALRYTTKDDTSHSEDIKKIVHDNFYVDDCLKSVDTKEEASFVIKETKTLLNQGGFNLTKFVVNDQDVLMEIPEKDQAKEVKVLNPSFTSKALGIHWNISLDEFHFQMKEYDDNQVTRRKMLSFVSSIFDPLGLLGPVLITGKMLFQEATRLRLPWDQEVPENIKIKWYLWLKELLNLAEIKVPRCVKTEDFSETNAVAELHHFSDASQNAYGCCSYLRFINQQGQIATSLLMSRSRVAPMKQLTIPRLELQAAVLSAKTENILRRELELGLGNSYFWTDSEIVLKYIHNETKRFQVFVGNRISLIHQFSRSTDWHYIRSNDNPADLISRGVTIKSLNHKRWIDGPEFLQMFKSEWTMNDTHYILSEDDPDVKKNTKNKSTRIKGSSLLTTKSNTITQEDKEDDSIQKLITHYSSWYRLKTAVALMKKFCSTLLNRQKNLNEDKPLSVSDIKDAEKIIIRYIQGTYYEKEKDELVKGRQIIRSSPMKKLNPVLDADGILRAGGRLRQANMGEDAKQPYIIPGQSHIAKLIIQDIHSAAHLGTEWVLSIIRRKYWITRARRYIRQVGKNCITCRKLYSKPACQKMADLPPERTQFGKPPFSYVGLDCFGPLYVKLNRAQIKRYGCIFTCLNTRAVHIEKLDDLSTDSFINGLRRFISRRGRPVKIWCDNGTNFKGAESELKRATRQLSQDDINSYCTKQEIIWKFNPPSASHMGGLWERMIRTIRKILCNLVGSTRVSDEILETFFCETESIINGRPITKMSSDIRDAAPLTPNHLLLLREGTQILPGKFGKTDLYQRRWRQCQYLAEQFWRKWVREYLPQLQQRNKWFYERRNIKIGDLVLILDESTPRNLWPMGLVVDINMGRDNLVRSVKIKTNSATLVRPITKVILLEGADENF